LEVDPELVIPNGRLTLAEGAIRPFNRINTDAWYMKKLQAVAERYGFSIHVPTSELTKTNWIKFCMARAKKHYRVSWESAAASILLMKVLIPNLRTTP
jgi:excinuclease UvrABC ATPase subunit